MSQRQVDALVAVGLLEPVSKPITPYVSVSDKREAIQGKFSALAVGDRVVITNDLYPWVDRWLPGDSGVVTRYANPVHEALLESHKWGLAIVKLDHPRKSGHEVCHFHRWELRKVDEVKP